MSTKTTRARVGDKVETLLVGLLGNDVYDQLFPYERMTAARERVVKDLEKGKNLTPWNQRRIELIDITHTVYGGGCWYCNSPKADLMMPANLSMNLDNKNDICTRLKTWDYPLMLDGRPISLCCVSCSKHSPIELNNDFIKGMQLSTLTGTEKNDFFRKMKQEANAKETVNQHTKDIDEEEREQRRQAQIERRAINYASAYKKVSHLTDKFKKRVSLRVRVFRDKPQDLDLLAKLEAWEDGSALLGFYLPGLETSSNKKNVVPLFEHANRVVSVDLNNLKGPARGTFNRKNYSVTSKRATKQNDR
jgi:hypothetical protein